MSNFYSEIANYYDYIFPVSNNTVEFIKECVGASPKEILDVACGSGLYSEALAKAGYQVTAVDLDEKMIGQLQQKHLGIKANVLNMVEIDKLDQTFDLIFCIGNSLAHLQDRQQIGEFLTASYQSLKPQGQLIIQIVNFDRIIAKNIKSLSTIENRDVGLRFERNYQYIEENHKINFHTVLDVQGKRLEHNVQLYPILSAELRILFHQAGFSDVEFFGNFTKQDFEPLESVPLIAIGRKKV